MSTKTCDVYICSNELTNAGNAQADGPAYEQWILDDQW